MRETRKGRRLWPWIGKRSSSLRNSASGAVAENRERTPSFTNEAPRPRPTPPAAATMAAPAELPRDMRAVADGRVVELLLPSRRRHGLPGRRVLVAAKAGQVLGNLDERTRECELEHNRPVRAVVVTERPDRAQCLGAGEA